MNYPSEKADSLGLYVRKTYHLSRMAQHLYESIRWLEMKKAKFCRTIFVGYREISNGARINIKSVKSALQELQMIGLVEVVIGNPVKSQMQATSIRRKTLEEIKIQSRQGDDESHLLAVALSKTTLRFGGKEPKPCWTVGKTGRVCSSRPNIQGMPSADRLDGLIWGLKEGQALVHADIKQAEPTIIKHLLKVPPERDLYREFMDATNRSRNEAKKAINTLSYCRDSMACFAHWPETAQTVLRDYVERLTAYKKGLFAASRKSRSVTTINGRCITAEKGIRLHSGIVMNWRVQGTVADIVNAACLRLMDSAIALVPMHDAIYAVVASDKIELVKESIIDKAREMGLTMKVETQVHHSGLVVPETTTRKTTSEGVKLYPKPPPITTKQGGMRTAIVDGEGCEVEGGLSVVEQFCHRVRKL